MSAVRYCPECGAESPAAAPEGLCPACLLRAGLESAAAAGSEPEPTVISPPSSGFVPPSPEELAARFPHLQILELLGKGGMGAVYKARQPQLDRFVALKILPPELGSDPAFEERFSREARAMARLSHPHVVVIYDFGQADGLFYFVMEYIEGTNLRQVIETKSLQPAEALAVVPQICEALEYAHGEGIVHRDIKPENILLDKRGRVKIADFGLSKLVTEQADISLTGSHQVMGTLRYMAPEQMQGSHAVDHRADIYSLGVVFYELLTGDVPMGRFDPPSRKVEIDVRLDEVVLKALEQEPAKRYQRAGEVKTDMETISLSETSVPSRAGVSDRILFRRLTILNLIVGAFLTLVWMVEHDVSLVLLLGQYAGLLWWSYLLLKPPDTPRSFADFWQTLQSDDARTLAWKRILWIALPAYMAVWLIPSFTALPGVPRDYGLDQPGATPPVAQFAGVWFHGGLGLLPLFLMATLWCACRERFRSKHPAAGTPVVASPDDLNESATGRLTRFFSQATGWIILFALLGSLATLLRWELVEFRGDDKLVVFSRRGYEALAGQLAIAINLILALALIDGVNLKSVSLWRPVVSIAAALGVLGVMASDVAGLWMTPRVSSGVYDGGWAGDGEQYTAFAEQLSYAIVERFRVLRYLAGFWLVGGCAVAMLMTASAQLIVHRRRARSVGENESPDDSTATASATPAVLAGIKKLERNDCESSGPEPGQTVDEDQPGASRQATERASESARQQVRGPAIGLLVLGGLSCAALGAILTGLVFDEQPVSLAAVRKLVSLLASPFLLAGGCAMLAVRHYWLALTGAVLALPHTIFYVAIVVGTKETDVASLAVAIGIGIGIWALNVLSRPEVRAAFGRTRVPQPDGTHAPEPVRRLIKAPAVCLFLISLMNWGIVSFYVTTVAAHGVPTDSLIAAFLELVEDRRDLQTASKFVPAGTALVIVLLNAAVMLGSLNMKWGHNWWLAGIAGLAAIVLSVEFVITAPTSHPLVVASCLGLPAGVWSLALLIRPDVRAAFAEKQASRDATGLDSAGQRPNEWS